MTASKKPDPRKAQKARLKAQRPAPTDPDVISHSATLGALVPTNTPKNKEEKVRVVMEIMRRLLWTQGKTARVLAARWSTSIAMIEQYSSEAHRRVAAEVEDPDRIKFMVGCALESSLLTALQEKDGRAIARVARTWADISGVSAAIRMRMQVERRASEELPEDPATQIAIMEAYLAKLKAGKGET